MNLNSENKQAIHDVLIADMQQRLYEDGKGIIFTKDKPMPLISSHRLAKGIIMS